MVGRRASSNEGVADSVPLPERDVPEDLCDGGPTLSRASKLLAFMAFSDRWRLRGSRGSEPARLCSGGAGTGAATGVGATAMTLWLDEERCEADADESR